MGDCRLRFLFSKEIGDLLDDTAVLSNNTHQHANHDPSSPWQSTITKVYSADTTVLEVCNDALGQEILKKLASRSLKLWDTTVHPPVDISEWPIKTYNKSSGAQSKTLFDAGWFPSGTFQVLKYDEAPKISAGLASDDSQYNIPDQHEQSAKLSARVQLKNVSSAKPSEVFESVAERFQDDPKPDVQQALQARKLTKEATLQKERERHKRLEERLQKLQSSGSMKNEKVSLQVQKMLLKSRCTGRSSLKMQDRVYLHIIILRDGDAENADYKPQEHFRFFSPQDTISRILSSLVTNLRSSQQQAEFLVKKRSGDSTAYRRLPSSMRLYEAIDNKYLDEVDSIVIRCYDTQGEEPTMSILDDDALVSDKSDYQEMNSDAEEFLADPSTSDDFAQAESAEGDLLRLPERAINALKKTVEVHSTKKASSALEKVRIMKIKSRAKGDAKRIPKMGSRFFLELLVATDDERKVSTNIVPVFLARSDPVGRLLRDCVLVPSGHTAHILMPLKHDVNLFQVVPEEKSLDMCEKDDVLKCFDRVIVYLHKQQDSMS
jgi:hypothetical protein